MSELYEKELEKINCGFCRYKMENFIDDIKFCTDSSKIKHAYSKLNIICHTFNCDQILDLILSSLSRRE
jgi:hypothetical protein